VTGEGIESEKDGNKESYGQKSSFTSFMGKEMRGLPGRRRAIDREEKKKERVVGP